MKRKLEKIENIIVLSVFLPLAAVFIAGIFVKDAGVAGIVIKIALALVGVMLVVGTQILPAFRLWDKLRMSNKLILTTAAVLVVYIGTYAYFYYSYAIRQDGGNLPLIIFLIVLLYQRFNPTDKLVEKFVSANLDMFPEEREKREQQKREQAEEARREAERIAEIERQEAQERENVPDFDEFFGLNEDDAKNQDNDGENKPEQENK